MATIVDSCSTSIARSDTDESEKYGSDENGKYVSDESEEYGRDKTEGYQSDEESDRYAPIHSPSVRGLPVELWWDILEITNDPRALLATGCTCKTLRDIVREIIEKRTHMRRLDDVLSDPTGGYFFSTTRIQSAELPSCISTYHTKSQRLQFMEISDGRLSLRSQMRTALSRLKSVTHLYLRYIHFSTFSDFARTVCALPNLYALELRVVTLGATLGATTGPDWGLRI
ncbi:hypothetical protein CERSUDRAFT_86322 [Gelatoporia subvermispora B]|uniref:F-box domain-containing protein n=1 Tax=Ceriporiopsis subvermispora (strain B) TaxID=914234 RepID=M2R5J9_CERS8|nr:hypothetical protein CERSUDRAFT_86322 [Gelatoporia subvermispora B]